MLKEKFRIVIRVWTNNLRFREVKISGKVSLQRAHCGIQHPGVILMFEYSSLCQYSSQ